MSSIVFSFSNAESCTLVLEGKYEKLKKWFWLQTILNHSGPSGSD
jgi:hypothetical protein